MTTPSNDDEYLASLADEESQILHEIEEARSNKRKWSEQAYQADQDCTRLRQQINQLTADAAREEQKRAKLESDARAEGNRVESLKYELLLLRLERDDEKVINLDAFFLPQGHVLDLGRALRKNTVLKSIRLNVHHFFPLNFTGDVMAMLEPLLDFLSTSPNLVIVDCTAGRNDSVIDVAAVLLRTIAMNKCIEHLSWSLPVAPLHFLHLMTSSPSLKSLDLDMTFVEGVQYSVDDRRMIASAFTTSTLTTLTLYMMPDNDFLIQILASMQEGSSSTLQKLVLEYNENDEETDEVFVALEQYLKSSAGTKLQCLRLAKLELNGSRMERLIAGLMLPSSDGSTSVGIPTVNVSSLEFTECYMVDDAFERFAAFLQTKTQGSKNEVVLQSALRYIYLAPPHFSLEAVEAELLASSLLMAVDESSKQLVPTIGSQIGTLNTHSLDAAFFRHLGENANRVRLQSLDMSSAQGENGEAFADCLPKLSSLQELKFCDEEIIYSLPSIYRGLKHNGSVCNVCIDPFDMSSGGDAPFDPLDFGPSRFSKTEQRWIRLIQACSQRNKLLGGLIDTAAKIANDNRRDAGDEEPGELTLLPNLCPALLEGAMPITNSRSATLMKGLLKQGQCIGYDK